MWTQYLSPGAYHVAHFTEATLNNDGDSVVLLDAGKNVVDEVEYVATVKGHSTVRFIFGLSRKERTILREGGGEGDFN